MGKPTMWFLTRYDTNQPVQSQKQARNLKFRIKEEEGLYYRVAKTKALICAFVFAYANCWFSHEAAHNNFLFSISAKILYFISSYFTLFCFVYFV